MVDKRYDLILASKSPRRREILSWLNIPFEIKAEEIEEISEFKKHVEIVCDISKKKGVIILDELSKRNDFGDLFFPIVVSSDTIVTLEDKSFGKPLDINHAREMLKELSGKTHKVITGVYMGKPDLISGKVQEKVFTCETSVTFCKITDDLLETYLSTKESLDKAGSYGIQGSALTFISGLEGSYSNVVGFPIDRFIDELKNFLGFKDDTTGSWRKIINGGQ